MSDGANGEWPTIDRRSNPTWQQEVERLDRGQVHIIGRLKAQDAVLADIRAILLVGKWGAALIRGLAITIGAGIGAYAAWKGIK